MRTYNLQLVRPYNDLLPGSLIRMREDEATALVEQGIAVWYIV